MALRGRLVSLPVAVLVGLLVIYVFIMLNTSPMSFMAMVDRWHEGRDRRHLVASNDSSGGVPNGGWTTDVFGGALGRQTLTPANRTNADGTNIDCGTVVTRLRSARHQDGGSEYQHPLDFVDELRAPCWMDDLSLRDVEDAKLNPYRSHKRRGTARQLDRLAELYEVRLNRSLTLRLRCLPSFLIIGQAKCGTTDLFLRLAKHPQIGVGLLKEPEWWTRGNGQYGKLLVRSKMPFTSYVDLYGYPAMKIEREWMQRCDQTRGQLQLKQCQQTIIGEASVAMLSDINPSEKQKILGDDFYGKFPAGHPRDIKSEYVKWILPEAKIIIILRDPATRLYSDYLFFDKKLSATQADFHRKVVRSIDTYRRCLRANTDQHCVYDKTNRQNLSVRLHLGLYSLFVDEWLKTFPRNRVLIFRTEDYSSQMKMMLQRVYGFLQICSPSHDVENFILGMNPKNQSPQNIGPMWNETRSILGRFYSGYNRDLARLLGDDRFLWKD